MTPLPLAVLASRVRFEEKQIFTALERRRVPYAHVDTRRFTAEVGGAVSGFEAPGYAAALNREISHSRSLYAALLLEAHGVPVVNRADVIEVCGDKLRTSLKLAAAGVPAPRTAVALAPEAGVEAAARLGFPLVIKPLVGSWGRLAAVVRDRETAVTVLEHRAALPSPLHHIAYLQELVGRPGGKTERRAPPSQAVRDIRVIVVGDAVIGATYRYADPDPETGDWRTNAARGAESRPCPVGPELSRLALDAARAVGGGARGGVLGVDLIEGADGLQVLEVNHAVEFRHFQAAHGDSIDVADAIVDHLLRTHLRGDREET